MNNLWKVCGRSAEALWKVGMQTRETMLVRVNCVLLKSRAPVDRGGQQLNSLPGASISPTPLRPGKQAGTATPPAALRSPWTNAMERTG